MSQTTKTHGQAPPHSGAVLRQVRDYLEQDAIQTKSWWKARHIHDKLDDPDFNQHDIGKALSAIYHDPNDPLIDDRRSATYAYTYHVDHQFTTGEVG